MNIFFTDPDPAKCAEYLDNKRTIKMVLESCQLLCTALNLNQVQSPYRTTHQNHPMAIWTRESRENYLWLLDHMKALLNEYSKRYNKTHKCAEYVEFLSANSDALPSLGLTPKPNCAANNSLGISYKHIDNVYEAYQLYLNHRWDLDKREPQWG